MGEIAVIYIGTSGYSYKDWNGKFYPKSLKSIDQLSFYSKEFNFLELNYTFYRIPEAKNLEKMALTVPDDFKFALKLHQSFTHEKTLDSSFVQALPGMNEKLVLLLAQFPYSFKCNDESKSYLLRLRDFFPKYQLTFEFRHNSWAKLEALDFVRDEDLNITSVDEPVLSGLLPPIVLDSGTVGYVRFHGRNHSKWWNNKASHERYTYEYSTDELGEWLPRLEYLETSFRESYVAFNNHYSAGAVRSARLLKELLKNNKILYR